MVKPITVVVLLNAEHIRGKRLLHAEMCNVDSSRKADTL